MSNSARGTGEPLLIGSEASCIIMGQASLLSHCGSSRITRRKEGGREREKRKTKAMEAGREGWVVWGGGTLFFTAAHQGSDKPTTVHQQPHIPIARTRTHTHAQRREQHLQECCFTPTEKKKRLCALFPVCCLLNIH